MPRTDLEPAPVFQRLSILNQDGALDEELEPDLDSDELRAMYRTMIRARRFDELLLEWQRGGRIGTSAPVSGQEASQVGAMSATTDRDWFVPAFREIAAFLWRGGDPVDMTIYNAGWNEGAAIPEEARDFPTAVPVASQIPHAAGLGYATKLRGEDDVVMTFFGDGATSEGDFHEALNFAGTFGLPVVFVCQNNQWAISVPRERQTASETLAQKALAYGIPGAQVDGNDVLAVRVAADEAVERARAGEGPTMIECVTYRLSVHTTAGAGGHHDLSRLGSRVTVVEMEDRILPLVDPELAEPLSEALGEVFEEIRLETSVESVEPDDDAVDVTMGGETERFDRVLVAVGRAPATGDLDLASTDATVDDDGYIEVDPERRTGDRGIFAIGDCNGGMGLAHEAMREGKVAADVIAGEPAAWDVRAVPAVVYTDPQIAWCGMTESEASKGDAEIRVARFPLRASGRARTMGDGGGIGLVKMIADAGSGRLLGVGMTGRHVESLVSEATLALEMGATATDLAQTIHAHPTLSEALGEAAEAILGVPTHFSAPAL